MKQTANRLIARLDELCTKHRLPAAVTLTAPGYGIHCLNVGRWCFYNRRLLPGVRTLASGPVLLQSARVIREDTPTKPPSLELGLAFLEAAAADEIRRVLKNLPEEKIEARFICQPDEMFLPRYTLATWPEWRPFAAIALRNEVVDYHETILSDVMGHSAAVLQDPKIQVVFAGAGRGWEVISYALANRSRVTRDTRLIVIDASPTILEESRGNIERGLRSIRVEDRPQMDYRCGDIVEELATLEGESIGSVFAIGLLDGLTMTFAKAFKVIEQMQRVMALGATAHIFAWETELFYPSHYKLMGFDVLRASVRRCIGTYAHPTGCVIAKTRPLQGIETELAQRIRKNRRAGSEFGQHLDYFRFSALAR